MKKGLSDTEPDSSISLHRDGLHRAEEDKDIRIAELEKKVARLQQDLQASRQAANRASEDLQAVNEELLVSNEELLRTNQKIYSINSAFEQVLEGTMAGYWDWMIQDNTEYLSSTFKSMFGYADHEMENTPDAWQKIIHPDDLPAVVECFENHVSSKGEVPYDNTVRYYHKDGSIVWVFCRGKVIEWAADGKPIRMVGSHVNVTELINAKGELEKVNEELKEFAYVASHDLKTPLRHIRQLTDWIIEDDAENLSESTFKRLKQLKARSKRLEDLLKDMDTFAKVGAADQEIALVSIAEVVADVLGDMNPPEAFSIRVNCVACTLKTSPFMLRIVLQNLISNAIKHHDREDGTVSIRCQTNPEDVEIQVIDDGPGIPEEQREYIFGLFKRLKSKDEVEGSGMGLAIVRKFVEHSRGRINVASTVGEGSTFTVTLPLSVDSYNR